MVSLLLTCQAHAEDFTVGKVGLAFSLPTGWRYAGRMEENTNFRRFTGPEGVVVVHPATPQPNTTEEALRLAAAHIAEHHRPGWAQTALLKAQPFLTPDGLSGVQGIFGTPGADPAAMVMHFVAGPNGHIACICLLHWRSAGDYEMLEKAIIGSVRHVEVNRSLHRTAGRRPLRRGCFCPRRR